jgi:hypothetical protein
MIVVARATTTITTSLSSIRAWHHLVHCLCLQFLQILAPTFVLHLVPPFHESASHSLPPIRR